MQNNEPRDGIPISAAPDFISLEPQTKDWDDLAADSTNMNLLELGYIQPEDI